MILTPLLKALLTSKPTILARFRDAFLEAQLLRGPRQGNCFNPRCDVSLEQHSRVVFLKCVLPGPSSSTETLLPLERSENVCVTGGQRLQLASPHGSVMYHLSLSLAWPENDFLS